MKTYNVHRRTYLDFCAKVDIPPVPLSPQGVALYAAFLARKLKPTSVRQYLNIVRLMHVECNLPNPCADNWMLKSTIRGIERVKGAPINRKVPIDPNLLLDIHQCLNLQDPFDAMFWAACLVMFFGTFRRSNLLPDSIKGFNPAKQFSRSDFKVLPSGFLEVVVSWSKTIQCKERTFCVHMPCIYPHRLCPVSALMNAFRLTPAGTSDGPAFLDQRKGLTCPLTGQVFNAYLKKLLLKGGHGNINVSSHSFRRGSATWALSCGVPGEIVKIMGDWKSSAYLAYVDQVPQHVRDFYRVQFADSLPPSRPS